MINSNRNWTKLEIFWLIFQVLFLFIISIYSAINSAILWIGIISIFATLSGAIGTFLATKRLGINFLFGIIHVVLYGIVALFSKVYGDFVLNLFIFLPLDIYGWIYWNNRDKKDFNNSNEVNIKKLGSTQWIISIGVLILAIIGGGYFLQWLNDPAPFFDAGSTVLSIFGMFLMTYYYREQWFIWFFVNVFSIAIWIQVLFISGDQMAWVWIAMWTIYLINSIIGIRNWTKKSKRNHPSLNS